MKRFAALILLIGSCTAFAAAAPQASLTRVKANHHHTQRHHAHKAAKHRAPKRHRRKT